MSARVTVQTERLSALTGLRFLAAMQVLLYHVVPWASWAMPQPLRAFLGNGFVAVSLFFVLSGFILTYVHASRGEVGIDIGRFYATRLARLYPVYALGLVLVAPVMIGHVVKVGGVQTAAVELVAVSTLVQSWFPLHALAWNAPGWSLSAEAFFYLAFPFFAPRILKCSVRAAFIVAGVAWLVSLAPAFAYQWLDPDHLGGHAGPSDQVFWLNALTFGPLARLPEFVVGVALGRLYFDVRVREAIRARAVPLSIGAVVVYVATCASSAVPYAILHNGLLVPVVAVLVLSLATDRGPVAWVLSVPALVALGDASYAMYILHVPIEMYALKALGHDAWLHSPALLAGYVGVVMLAALACFRWFETPIRNDILAMIRRKKVKPVEGVVGGLAG